MNQQVIYQGVVSLRNFLALEQFSLLLDMFQAACYNCFRENTNSTSPSFCRMLIKEMSDQPKVKSLLLKKHRNLLRSPHLYR